MNTHAGYIALLGRPNVGKSTLLNSLIEQKLSITSHKPQTTRHTLLGIKTVPAVQFVYVDTPGLHLGEHRAINRHMNRAAGQVLDYVDVVVMLVEALRWTEEDDEVIHRLASYQGPVILAVNKVDRVADKPLLLPFIEKISQKRTFADIVPISALKDDNLDTLETVLARYLPEGEFLFPDDQLTTASQRFLAAEIIREKLMRQLHEELPYALTVEIEEYEQEGRLARIGAVIWVERPGQKAIVIGSKGETLKEIGRQARLDMEQLFDCKVFLRTWVKVREGWADDEKALRSLGYFNNE